MRDIESRTEAIATGSLLFVSSLFTATATLSIVVVMQFVLEIDQNIS